MRSVSFLKSLSELAKLIQYSYFTFVDLFNGQIRTIRLVTRCVIQTIWQNEYEDIPKKSRRRRLLSSGFAISQVCDYLDVDIWPASSDARTPIIENKALQS